MKNEKPENSACRPPRHAPVPSAGIDRTRRNVLGAAGGGAFLAAIGGTMTTVTGAHAQSAIETPLRWGIVGTGMIANQMAPKIIEADGATLAAVSSRKMESARDFASDHDIGKAFDSWEEMLSWDGVDAVYVATPTIVREDISVAAANAGKHVLAEKPFASLASFERIASACRANDVGLMDGTHFVHAPRTAHIKANMNDTTGWPWSVASAFQFNLQDRSNIRYNAKLEPMGAIGDAGWYNMRATAEFVSPTARLVSAEAYLRRDTKTGAVISGSGVMLFDDGATSTWNCGFDSRALVMDLRISGAQGSILLDDFVHDSSEGDAQYTVRRGGPGSPNDDEQISSDASLHSAVRMFEDFTRMAGDPGLIAQSIAASRRTQELLDASWEAALRQEKNLAG
jgi:predicted dehydrogenase